jgi:hypothetical protein
MYDKLSSDDEETQYIVKCCSESSREVSKEGASIGYLRERENRRVKLDRRIAKDEAEHGF